MNDDMKAILAALALVAGFIALALWGLPKYNVWVHELEWRAELARAEQNRKIEILESNASLEAETPNTQAEGGHAKGWTVATVVFGAIALAAGVWVYRRRKWRKEESEKLAWERGTKIGALKVTREFLRLKLRTGGRGKHHAYHVAKNGALLAVDALDYYFAVLSGMDDFWYEVASAGAVGGNPFAVSLDEVCLGDGKGDFTYIHNLSGKVFIDGIAPVDLLHPDDCARVTADDFKNAVIDGQAEAAKRNRSRYSMAV